MAGRIPICEWKQVDQWTWSIHRAAQHKDGVAPWWATNSREAYSSGISDLVVALSNWSKSGARKGKKGCPRRSSHKTKAKVMAGCGEAETLPRKGKSLE